MIESRGFLPVVKEKMRECKEEPFFYYPQRSTKFSAGYDFKTPVSFMILPGARIKIYTNVKAYMLEDEYLDIHIRSSIGMKKYLRLVNCVGIIDADYFENESNDGNIIIGLENEGQKIVTIHKGERIAQGIFKKYLKIDNDNPESEYRTGGLGSTGL